MSAAAPEPSPSPTPTSWAWGTEPGPKGEADELLVLHAGGGDSLVLRAREWRDGPAAVTAVRAALPAGLFVAAPEGMRVMSAE